MSEGYNESAFPRPHAMMPNGNIEYGENGMTLRDYFAASCSHGEIKHRLPSTIGEMRDELIKRKLIPENKKHVDVFKSYTEKDVQKLKAIIRYEYADDMLEARKGAADE